MVIEKTLLIKNCSQLNHKIWSKSCQNFLDVDGAAKSKRNFKNIIIKYYMVYASTLIKKKVSNDQLFDRSLLPPKPIQIAKL